MPDSALLEDPGLLATAWDLEPLVDGKGEPGVESLLAEARRGAEAFASEHAGKVDRLDGPGLVAAMEELARIHDLAGRAATYASLAFAVATNDPARGALLQKVEEELTAVQTTLL